MADSAQNDPSAFLDPRNYAVQNTGGSNTGFFTRPGAVQPGRGDINVGPGGNWIQNLDPQTESLMRSYITRLSNLDPDQLAQMKQNGVPDEHSLQTHMDQLGAQEKAMGGNFSQAISGRAQRAFGAQVNQLAQRNQIAAQTEYATNLQTAQQMSMQQARIAVGAYQRSADAQNQMTTLRANMLGNLIGGAGNFAAGGIKSSKNSGGTDSNFSSSLDQLGSFNESNAGGE